MLREDDCIAVIVHCAAQLLMVDFAENVFERLTVLWCIRRQLTSSTNFGAEAWRRLCPSSLETWNASIARKDDCQLQANCRDANGG